MIQTERWEGNDRLIRTFSDAGMKIIQDGTGILYDEAVDPEEMGRTYTESDIRRDDWEEVTEDMAQDVQDEPEDGTQEAPDDPAE